MLQRFYGTLQVLYGSLRTAAWVIVVLYFLAVVGLLVFIAILRQSGRPVEPPEVRITNQTGTAYHVVLLPFTLDGKPFDVRVTPFEVGPYEDLQHQEVPVRHEYSYETLHVAVCLFPMECRPEPTFHTFVLFAAHLQKHWKTGESITYDMGQVILRSEEQGGSLVVPFALPKTDPTTATLKLPDMEVSPWRR